MEKNSLCVHASIKLAPWLPVRSKDKDKPIQGLSLKGF